MFHVHSWISFVHRLIERRFYHPYDRTGYVGFSIQARFLNLVLAVLVGLYRNVRIIDLNLSVGITNPRRLNLIFIYIFYK